MIDRKWIGHELPASVLPLERTRLQFFAKAIGETDPVYTDPAAARDAGYADLPAPPTFLFAAELDSGASNRLLADLGIPLAKLLHGEQGFSYHRAACAGDTVTVRSTITDIYDKKNGALEFVVKSSRATNQRDELVAELRTVIVCRH
ncbi:acyl dehydratase [Variovorax paradoxus]|jgi:acyl dehydratase|uniref:MaoC family dehydratase N-terminal domain-containing protein n=1 Tax=Variovorax TaxID=34072 RepID=UPI0006E4D3DA|nr:MaoC family dehydratase N-terminal domain-containing protein [Variovorax sp. CY25R-8]KPU89088.1 acyl dehydratase [Variovorax paradoxus]KPU92904.1 acyl dehydratase [Variovorax paradoxus]KPU96929.1 acyl dehydratase [Variovorax paradoxus]KPV14848.1 acyl dehydratase [Variovorax paradoxus]KPV21292.1 acyl dehydratase [Variovorax paradoxus]